MLKRQKRSIEIEAACWRCAYFYLIAVSPLSCSVDAFAPQRKNHRLFIITRTNSPNRIRSATIQNAAGPSNLVSLLPSLTRETPAQESSTQTITPQDDDDDDDDDVFFPFFPTSASSTTITTTSSSPSTTRASDMSMPQMVAMNAVGAAMTVGIVYALASSNLNGLLTGATTEDFEAVSFNIVDAALPSSATEVVSVTFSEAVAAVVAAAVSLSFSLLVRLTSLSSLMQQQQQQQQQRGRQRKANDKNGPFDDIQKAVGNGDFLLAQATTLPLLESLGVPTVVGVLFAAIPAELVKVASRKSRERRAAEDDFFDYLLQQEQQKKQRGRSLFSMGTPSQAIPTAEIMEEWQESIAEKTKSQEQSLLVDIASDIIKWLGYSVLCSDLSGELVYNGLPLFPGVESAIFGVIASMSAQVYADILYSYFGFGGEEKQQEIRSRTLFSWASTYFSEAAYSGIFFGMYEFAQIPAKASVSAFLSGGVDSCYGSQDFDICLQAFESQNPPGASPEAQLASLVTTLVSLWNRYTPDLSWMG